MRNAQNNLQINFGNAYTGNFNLEIKGKKWAKIGITVPIKFSILGKSKLISQLTFKAMVLAGTWLFLWHGSQLTGGKLPGPPGTHL